MEDDFEKKDSSILNNDSWNGFLGIQRGARFHTKAGVSSLYSEVYFLNNVTEEEVKGVPDYILSDTLQKDVDSSIMVCLWGLQKTKYFPSTTKTTVRMGAIPGGEREGVWVTGWQDYNIMSATGAPLYSAEILEADIDEGGSPLSTALWHIVKDICDTGGFLTLDWYRARMHTRYNGGNNGSLMLSYAEAGALPARGTSGSRTANPSWRTCWNALASLTKPG